MAKPLGMRGGGLHAQEKKNEVSLDKCSPPLSSFSQAGIPGMVHPQGSNIGVAPSGLAPRPRGASKSGTEEQQHNALLPALRELWQGTF